MKTIKVLAFAMLCIMGLGNANAQEKVEGSFSADVVSRYVWRGQVLGDAAVQPSAGISYKGFSLSAWGSLGFVESSDTREFDLTLGYSAGRFNIGITDYWFSYDGLDNKYFNYSSHTTKHVWEANVGYDFGVLDFQWYTNFAGDDGSNKNGKRAYSSYVQLTAPFKFVDCDWTATLGAVPYATSLYSDANGFAVTYMALRVGRDITLCKRWKLPVFVEASCNPSTEKGYLVAGFTIAP